MKFLIQEKFDPLFEKAVVDNGVSVVRYGDASFMYGSCEYNIINYISNSKIEFDNVIFHAMFFSSLDESLNKFAFTKINNLNKRKWSLFINNAVDAKIFIRPESGSKSFSGFLIDIIEFDKFLEEIKSKKIGDSICCISKPKKILAEWRLVCTATEVVTSSLYSFQGLLSSVKGCPPMVKEFAKKILVKLSNPPKMFVVDICMLEGSKELKLVEFNSIRSSGFYACDRDLIVKELIKVLK